MAFFFRLRQSPLIEIVLSALSVPPWQVPAINCGLKRLHGKFQKETVHVSFQLGAIPSSVLKSGAGLLRPTWSVNPPFVHGILTVRACPSRGGHLGYQTARPGITGTLHRGLPPPPPST